MKANDEVKRQAMSAIANMQPLAHISMAQLTGGVALYAARIRQMDRQDPPRQQKVKKRAFGRSI